MKINNDFSFSPIQLAAKGFTKKSLIRRQVKKKTEKKT
jgi:hypothetical protein